MEERFYILLMIIAIICYLGSGLNIALNLDLKDPEESLSPRLRLVIIFFWFFLGIRYAIFGIPKNKPEK